MHTLSWEWTLRIAFRGNEWEVAACDATRSHLWKRVGADLHLAAETIDGVTVCIVDTDSLDLLISCLTVLCAWPTTVGPPQLAQADPVAEEQPTPEANKEADGSGKTAASGRHAL